jgi:hypothetical protein
MPLLADRTSAFLRTQSAMLPLDPFTLFGKLVLAAFRIVGYLIACAGQAVWYAAHGRTDKIGDAIGFFGRGLTDALAEIFEKPRR